MFRKARYIWSTYFVCLLVAVSLMSVLFIKNASAMVLYKIERIQAFLYYHDTGKFGSKDLVSEKSSLWNTIIGEGDASSPSSTTLALVYLTGPKFRRKVNGSVVLTATIDGKLVSKQTVNLKYVNSENNNVTVPYIIYGTGCGKLVLKAEVDVENGKMKDTKSAVINFGCGE